MQHHHYIFSSLDLIGQYDGTIPLHHFLKNYFRRNKKYGARDRRWIKEICYAWFRTAFFLDTVPAEIRIYPAFYLVNNLDVETAHSILRFSDTELVGSRFSDSIYEKIKRVKSVYPQVVASSFFRTDIAFSPDLDKEALSLAMITKPRVWIRVKKFAEEKAETELRNAGIAFEKHPQLAGAWSVDPDSKLEDTQLFEQGGAEVQDLSSQKTGVMMEPVAGAHWYDACAASGGKSLLLIEQNPEIILTVSDSRESILVNLKERFRRNGIRNYNSLVLDLVTDDSHDFYKNRFDGIIADVPCSGSGTWTRNPEQQLFFSDALLRKYINMQDVITRRLAKLLLPGGTLMYITCSVFKAENEDRIAVIASEEGFSIKDSKLIQGSKEGADTLFVASLVKK